MTRIIVTDLILLAAILGLIWWVCAKAPTDPNHHYDDRD